MTGISTAAEDAQEGTTASVDTAGTDGSGATPSTSGSMSSSESGSSDDYYSQCAAAMSEGECEGIVLESNREFPNPVCQWRDIHSVEFSIDTGCALAGTAQRCVLFFGYLQGCGGGPECPGAEGKSYVRDIDTGVEVLFYPYDSICGPFPEAPPDEPEWLPCDGRPDHEACACICDVI